jgi:hypothetical protein
VIQYDFIGIKPWESFDETDGGYFGIGSGSGGFCGAKANCSG